MHAFARQRFCGHPRVHFGESGHPYAPDRAFPSDGTGTGNKLQWQLNQIGLDLKEQQQWPSATIIDQVAEELNALRKEIVEKATLTTVDIVFDATPHIADWHRRLSKVRPVTWVMLQPWPSKRYEHMACISVDETTGEWHEEEPRKK